MDRETDGFKQAAAMRGVEFVRSGMVVGLGTGSTAIRAIREIGARLSDGRLRDIVGVPSSEETARHAREVGIPLVDRAEIPIIDLAIDGADEVDPNLCLIKGGGGALLREKLVAEAARRFVVVADESKRVPVLGSHAPVPVVVVPFGWRSHLDGLAQLGCRPELRRKADGEPWVTDDGGYILDCHFTGIADPRSVARALKSRTGVMEHGIFVSTTSLAVIAGPEGVQLFDAGS